MADSLHPSTLGEILDRTAHLYRVRFLVFLGIASFPIGLLLVYAGGIALLVSWANTGEKPQNVDPTGYAIAVFSLVAIGFAALALFLGVSALAAAAMNHAASRASLGQTITIRDSYKAAWRRGWRAIGLYFVEIIAIWVLPFGAWFVLVFLSAGIAALMASLGIGGGGFFFLIEFLVVVGLAVYGFWIALQLSLAFPTFVVEQMGVWAALRRSFSLAKGTRGRILLLYLLCAALNWILSMAVMFPVLIGMALIRGAGSPQNAQTFGIVLALVIYGSGFLVQALTRPVYGIALMLFYYDQRIRQEGFDIEWMMLTAGLIVPADHPAPLLPEGGNDSSHGWSGAESGEATPMDALSPVGAGRSIPAIPAIHPVENDPTTEHELGETL